MAFHTNYNPLLIEFLEALGQCEHDWPEHWREWLAICVTDGLVTKELTGGSGWEEFDPKSIAVEITDLGRAVVLEYRRNNPKPEVSNQRTKGKRIEAILDQEDMQIMAIASSKKTVDEKMRAICAVDQRYCVWNSERWAALLGVSSAAIRSTEFWKNRRVAIEAMRE